MNPNFDFYRSGIDQAHLSGIQRYETDPNMSYGHGLPVSNTTSLTNNQSIHSGHASFPQQSYLIQGAVPMNPPQFMNNQVIQNSPSGTLNANPIQGIRSNLRYLTNPPVVMPPPVLGRPDTTQALIFGNQIANIPLSGNTGNIIGANPMGNNLPNNTGLLNNYLSSSSSISSIPNANKLSLNNPHVQGNNFPMPAYPLLLPQGNPQTNLIPEFPSPPPQLPPMPAFNPMLSNNNQVPLPPVPSNIPLPGINFPPQNNIPVPPGITNFLGNNSLAGNPYSPVFSNDIPISPANDSNLSSNPPRPTFPILKGPGLPIPNGLGFQEFPIPNQSPIPRLPNPVSMAINLPLPPQGNLPQSSQKPQNEILSCSSSESSMVITRVSINSKDIQKAQDSGDFTRITSQFPQVKVFTDNAGEGQEYLNLKGPKSDVDSVSKLLDGLKTQSDTIWRWLDHIGEFKKYPREVSDMIEEKFLRFESEAEFDTGTHKFTIVFGTNGNPHTQVSTSNKQSIYRTVRRGPSAELNKFAESDIIWYWSDEVTNKMKNYEPEACKAIEFFYQKFLKENRGIKLRDLSDNELDAFILKASVLVWGTSGFSYMMDFANMVQINEKTRRWRGISRGNPNGTLRVSQPYPEAIPYIPHPDLD